MGAASGVGRKTWVEYDVGLIPCSHGRALSGQFCDGEKGEGIWMQDGRWKMED